jgi:hypothetical protein
VFGNIGIRFCFLVHSVEAATFFDGDHSLVDAYKSCRMDHGSGSPSTRHGNVPYPTITTWHHDRRVHVVQAQAAHHFWVDAAALHDSFDTNFQDIEFSRDYKSKLWPVPLKN